ncbi:T9SS type A sorting domain-containing protein [Polaribacter sargassicola]|uniref:T9SS type A sorting domain-containing protein n=1 Tax=Polaribacter sargassicola TaxID=2836891 RepID=UPI001F213FB0|nr:T9SS type A sorting domain-containing protein [Polaribacter sp. DS7-9]MCG1035818.1 T9SS type A sorting domain-containing protein [Polaribacter sp. DS7-9]
MNLKITIQFCCLLFITKLTAQSITIDAGNLKQKIEFIGADYERSQNFVQKATNPEEIIDWAFKDINFNIARVAYDKIQKTENYKFEVEANNITATGTYVQWQLLDDENGFVYIQNVGSNTHLQTTNEILEDGSGNRVFSRPARSCTGSWCKWKMIESETNPGFYNIRNVGLNKYLFCTSDPSVNSGLFIKSVEVNNANALDEASLWSISQQGTSETKIFIDNKKFQKRLRYTDVDEVVENMAFYNDAIKTMQTIKNVNPDVKFLATMRSDYNGYNSDNRNNLPEYIYNYSCVEADEDGKCIRTLGNKSFNTDAFGVFLADYLELMHNNGVTISYLATAKEWTSVVTAQRSHDTYQKLVSECANRNIPLPQIIGPASWSLSQGISYVNNVSTLGFKDEYHSFSSHNLNSQDDLFDDFFNAANSVGKKAWDDESSAGGGSRTSGVNPDISLALAAYKEKTELYKGGLFGECFFEVNSRGVNSETRTIYFKNNTEAKRLRSYYIMKDFANATINKNYVETTHLSLTDVYTMAFVLNDKFTLVVVNDAEQDVSDVTINLNNFQLNANINKITWTNDLADEGEQTSIVKENLNSFKTDIKSKSISIYTIDESTLSSSKQINENETINIFPNPSKNNYLNIDINDTYLYEEDVVFSIADSRGRIVKEGFLEKDKQINVNNFSKGVYYLILRFKNYKKTLKLIRI